MAINLQKGQKIDLTKGDGGQLNRVMVGLGWDQAENSKGGLFGMLKAAAPTVDCDASIILCGEDGRRLPGGANDCCIYFGNKVNANGSIMHQGDNLTGEGDGDDEKIMVKLQELPPFYDKLVFVVNIYQAGQKGQHFGLIKNCFIRIVDLDTNAEICRFNLTDNYANMQGLVVGEIYRKNGAWKFNAIGQGVANASTLDGLINLYNN